MGMAEIAIASLYVVTYSSWKRRSPTGTVRSSAWVTMTNGQTNASHVSRPRASAGRCLSKPGGPCQAHLRPWDPRPVTTR
jgi:hypothetical protein